MRTCCFRPVKTGKRADEVRYSAIAYRRVDGERMSLRKISAELATAGHVNERRAPFNAKSILAMIEGPMPEKRET
jgi:hypothetical protein